MRKRLVSKQSWAEPGTSWSWRLGWLGMLLIHLVPALARGHGLLGDATNGEESTSPYRMVVLAIASAFFALKIIDVRWLRFRTDLRSVVCWLVVFSVLHLGVLSRYVNDYSGPPTGELGVVLFVSGAVAAGTALGLFALAGNLRRYRTLTASAFSLAMAECVISHSWCGISHSPPRAPPI